MPTTCAAAVVSLQRCTRPGHVDAGEEEQPDDVDEVPVPGRRLEAEMVVRLEMSGVGAEPADDEEDRADDHMRAMEARRHEESRGVDAVAETEGRMAVFVCLDAGEGGTEENGESEALQETLAVALAQRMVSTGHGDEGRQKKKQVQEWQLERIEGVDRGRRPDLADRFGRKQAGVEIGPEPSPEEHHLGGDE